MYADSGGHRVLEESLESRFGIEETEKSIFNRFTCQDTYCIVLSLSGNMLDIIPFRN